MLLDFDCHSFFAYIETLSDIFAPLAQDELLPGLKEAMEKQMDAAEQAVAAKTEQVAALVSIVVIPIALLAGALLLNLAFGVFTGTVDAVTGKTVKGMDALRLAWARYKSSLTKDDEDYEEDEDEYGDEYYDEESEESEEEALKGKKPARVMRFGEILKRYVLPSVDEADIEKAVTMQAGDETNKKIGEILLDMEVIASYDVDRTLKIQERQRSASKA